MGFFNSFTSFNMNMFGGFGFGFCSSFMSFARTPIFSTPFTGIFSNWTNPFSYNFGLFNNNFSYRPNYSYTPSIWQSGSYCNTGTFRYNPYSTTGLSSGTSIFNNNSSSNGKFKYNPTTFTPTTFNYTNPYSNISYTPTHSTTKTKRKSQKSKASKANNRSYTGVGNARTRTEYANQNKRINAGKLRNLPAFQDRTGRAEMCNPAVVDTLVDLAKEAQRRGYRIVVSSSYRTTADQQRLRKTRGAYGKGGYAAAPGTSPHEFGQAIDFEVWKGNQKITIGRNTTPWVLAILSKHNMVWGGTFSTREPWHFNTANAKSYRRQLA